MDSPCIKQTVCKVFKIFQCGKYLVAYVLKKLQFLAVTYDMFFFIVVLSALSKLQCVFPLFMQILGTEMTWSQTIIVRECIFNNQNLLFTSR